MARVLIGYSACPLTRAAFEAQGHEVWTCDLLPSRDLAMFHHQCDVWEALENRGPWDFAVLHPMCTYLTVSAAWAFTDGPYHQKVKPGTLVGADRRAARERELENFRRLLALPFPVAIENPAISFINTAIRRYDQVIHPFQFGDDASKATGLWLTHGTPILKIDPDAYRPPRLICSNKHSFTYGEPCCPECGSEKYLPRWANQTDSGQNRLSPREDRWLERSATYPGIAAAMGSQWGAWLNSK